VPVIKAFAAEFAGAWDIFVFFCVFHLIYDRYLLHCC
jgi:hypothetical protein